MLRRLALVLWVVWWFPATVAPLAAEDVKDPSRVLPAGKLPADVRLGKLRDLYDKYHPWSPPATREAWEREAAAVRERVLVSNGLWPMPPRTPLEPVVHGKIDRGDYTVERVFFASLPGHYVTGNLYRPKKTEGQAPGILCPHGHWPNGRFHDAGEQAARQQIDQGAESLPAAARHPVQARMVHLARMGCVVFHYDMIGYADSRPLAHRGGFNDPEASLRLQNPMGLQTYNSIRALDFLLSLPDVDPERIGVTGSSGGGTQTFMLCAIDPRPAVAFPAVMVSTAMQGGCVCENADYLRIGINNITLAALFAPRPQAMSGADDWTIDIETRGLPELRQVYGFYDKPDHVHAKAYPQFKHNYNQVAREMMYEWFNRHLDLGQESPVTEREFEPLSREEMTVFTDEHPFPDDAKSASELRDGMTETSEKQFAELLARDADGVAEYRRVVSTAARVMLDAGVPQEKEIEADLKTVPLDKGLRLTRGTLGRAGADEQVPFVAIVPEEFDGTVVLWIDGRGKSHLFDDNGRVAPAAARLLQAGKAVASADVFLTGEFVEQGKEPQFPKVHESYPGYTFGYNRPVLANRVRDTLTALTAGKQLPNAKSVVLVGTGEAGPWVLLAAGLAGDRVTETIADIGEFRFGRVQEASDPMFLPGALKYGGLGGLAALAAPAKLTIAAGKDVSMTELAPLKAVYQAAGGELSLPLPSPLAPDAVADLLLKR